MVHSFFGHFTTPFELRKLHRAELDRKMITIREQVRILKETLMAYLKVPYQRSPGGDWGKPWKPLAMPIARPKFEPVCRDYAVCS
jgi:hypothetical protein